MVRPLICAILLLIAMTAQAARLDAHIDRHQAEMGDIITLTLTLKGVDVTQQVETPDFSSLEKDFRILGRQRNTQLMMQNGQVGKFEQWQLQITPRHTGTVTIPAFEIANSQSRPVRVTVHPAPPALERTPPFFLKNSVDTLSPHVQQQVHYRVRLYYRGELINGAVSPPAPTDARIVPLSEQQIFHKRIRDVTYTVIEWHYALFPRRDGPLTIPAQGFTGQLYLNQKLKQVSGRTQPITLRVRPIPKSWPDGHDWLPGSRVILQAQWHVPDHPKTGDSLTLTATLTARDMPGEQLPDLKPPRMDGTRVYPEPTRTDTQRTGETLIGRKTYRWTFLLTRSGEITLTHLSVPWWNTRKDRLEWARTASRTLQVQTDAGSPVLKPVEASPPSTIDEHPTLWPWQLATTLLALLSAWLIFRLYGKRSRSSAITPLPTVHTTSQKKPTTRCERQPIEAFYNHLLSRPERHHPRIHVLFRALERALFKDNDSEQARTLQKKLCHLLTDADNRDRFDDTSSLKPVYPTSNRGEKS